MKKISIVDYVTNSNNIAVICDEIGYINHYSKWFIDKFPKKIKKKKLHVSDFIIDFNTNVFSKLISNLNSQIVEYTFADKINSAKIEFEKLEKNGYLIKGTDVTNYTDAKKELEFVNKISELNFNRLHKILTQLEESEKKIKENTKVKELFIAKVSHEIRSPLNIIIGFTELLQGNITNDDRDEYVQSIQIASKNLLNLINNVLDFSKIESGKIEKNLIQVNVEELVNNISRIFKYKAQEKNNIIKLNIALPKNSFYEIDPNHYTQILLNLLTNAIKFTSNGIIEVNLKYKDFQLTTEIKDNGIGINLDEQQLIFNAFEQSKNNFVNTNKHQGTGLGLSIVKQLVEINDGKIKLTSAINKGASFIFSIPTEQHMSKKNIETYKVPIKEIDLQNKKILLAEDQELNQKLISKSLSNYGAIVTCVANGQEAVNEIQNNYFDLFITDINMPILNGIEATKIIRKKLNYKNPILCITADVTNEMRKKVLQVGANEILNKPFQIEDLKNTLMAISKLEIDLTYFKKLASNDTLFFNEIIKTLITQLETDFASLESAIEKNNITDVQLLSHKIKGTISPLYNKDLNKTITTFNNKSKENKIDFQTFESIQPKIKLLVQTLKNYNYEFQ